MNGHQGKIQVHSSTYNCKFPKKVCIKNAVKLQFSPVMLNNGSYYEIISIHNIDLTENNWILNVLPEYLVIQLVLWTYNMPLKVNQDPLWFVICNQTYSAVAPLTNMG